MADITDQSELTTKQSTRPLPRDAVKKEMAKRLQNLLLEKGWNQSDLARYAAKYMSSNKFGRDNVSAYVRGISLPGPKHLKALAAALGVAPSEIVPENMLSPLENNIPTLEITDIGHGLAWLRANRAVKWTTALKISQLLHEDMTSL